MPRKAVRKSSPDHSIVTFDLNDRTYQIDPQRRKVYRRFVELETSKAAEILSLWRARSASV